MAFAAFGGGAPAVDSGTLKRAGGIALLLMAPGLAYLALFYLTPLISLIITSLEPHEVFNRDQAVSTEISGLGTYWQAIEAYWPHFIRSFAYSLLATLFCILIGYPMAYFIGVTLRKRPMLQALGLILVIAPFFISFLLRTLAWKQILGSNGWIASALHGLGWLPPGQSIVGTDFSVVFGLTYNFIPFMVLPIFATLERLDTRYLEAGADLYAKPSTTFWRVTLPLSMPGVVSGTLLTFIPASGDFINAAQEYLGGPGTAMVGNVIEGTFLRSGEVQLASGLSVLLMGVILILVATYVRKSGTEDLL